MPNSRTITGRNLLGAFFGGALGILTLGLITPWLLPVGCLLGVVFGFWYDVLWHDFRTRDAGGARLISVKTLRLLGWYNQSRSKQITHVHRLATLVFYTIALTGWFFLLDWSWTHLPLEQIKTGHGIGFFLALIGCCLMMFLPGLIGLYILAEPLAFTGRRTYARQWRRLQRDGLTRFFLFCCLSRFRDLLGISLMVIVRNGLVSLLALAHFIAVTLPTALFIGGLRLADAFAVRWQYLLCLATTLALTTFTAVRFHGQLHGPQLWLIALVAGCVSGVVAEGLRRVLAAGLSRLPARLIQLRDGNLESFVDQLEYRGKAWREAVVRPMTLAFRALQVEV